MWPVGWRCSRRGLGGWRALASLAAAGGLKHRAAEGNVLRVYTSGQGGELDLYPERQRPPRRQNRII